MVKLQTLIMDNNYLNETVPDWFDSLSNLTVLSLKNNQLKGPFPSSIRGITTLTDLVLSGNEISGKVPQLSGLTSLRVLDLSGNKLDSDLPNFPKVLVMVFLGNNSFSGEIPKQYSQLHQLQQLDLSINALTGNFPAWLFSLPNIVYLNLASNILSGSLPNHLSCGSKLEFVDLSYNRLIGELPSCLSTESDGRVVKLDGNCLSNDTHQQHAESYCVEEINVKKKQSGGINVATLVGVIVGILVVVVLLAFVSIIVCRRYGSRGVSEQHLLHKAVSDNSATGFTSEILTNARFISETAKLGTECLPVCRQFTLEELKEVTNNFDNSGFMGEGSCGKLYKGRLENGTQVVIRCLSSSKKYSIRNLKLRLDLLAKLRHPYLVCLLGHCMDVGGRDDNYVNRIFLVYEYVSNGNFRTHLAENSPGKVLNWSRRLAVLIGVAKGVHFLHTGVIPGFFNNRLKTNNILLNNHGIAKLSDYGLSIVSEESSNDGVRLVVLLIKGQMTMLEDDVYSFGFIILESLVGPSISTQREAFIRDELEIFNSQDGRKKVVNPVVLATCSQESLSTVISIASKCICSESWSRPSFEDILWNLQYAAQVQATADGDKKI
ncbi:Pkinase domain-containing protein/LRR_4 domain-containing protein/LRR_7 domain-containing protein [Cephalotus follicularis]|uniref:Pkinase domain-containing protein/LRR_4 domain-containing protein/LRR_7 domain-containing protein n=1 Tax=Cephalotus follicularis TaxID=3775 RepID=A0A1Q3ALA3_CEPFO|nr:Pkinase domain-containing protein/LRR_4 domain-containing protein/LRR_7 domain-containing protein [Cephalotus follicularis]